VGLEEDDGPQAPCELFHGLHPALQIPRLGEFCPREEPELSSVGGYDGLRAGEIHGPSRKRLDGIGIYHEREEARRLRYYF